MSGIAGGNDFLALRTEDFEHGAFVVLLRGVCESLAGGFGSGIGFFAGILGAGDYGKGGGENYGNNDSFAIS